MAEKLSVVKTATPEFRCPKCSASVIDAVGEATIESGGLCVTIELRCFSCHVTIGELKLEGSAPEDEYGDDE